MSEEMMIGGQLLTKGEGMMDTHSPDEFLPKETELTSNDIDAITQEAAQVFDGQVTAVEVDNSLFGSLMGYQPTPVEEKEFGPKILQGKYNAIITRFQRSTGTWPSGDPYDKYQVSVQITDTVDAKVDGTNMYIGRDYNLLDTDWKTGQQSIEDMLNELNQFVAPVEVQGSSPDEIFESIDNAIANLIGEPVTIRAWAQKYKKDWNDKKAGDYKTDKKGYVKHAFSFATRVNLDSDVIDI